MFYQSEIVGTSACANSQLFKNNIKKEKNERKIKRKKLLLTA
jgi:hypothetical protein